MAISEGKDADNRVPRTAVLLLQYIQTFKESGNEFMHLGS